MITNSDKRLEFARKVGVRNYKEQDYKNKHLIIVNHGTERVLESNEENAYELMVNKGNLSLGDLRNLSLELVPLNSIFNVWDDDDIKTTNYLSILVDTLLKEKAFAIFIQYRIEYALNTQFSYIHKFENGTTHVMMWKLDKFRYLNKHTLEDVNIQENLYSFKKKYVLLDNDPKMYIRISHNLDNTSPFANSNRTNIISYNLNNLYKEYKISDYDKTYVDTIIKKYIL
jgi:hypothetical protein